MHQLLENLETHNDSILVKEDLEKMNIKDKGGLMLKYIGKFVEEAQKIKKGKTFDVGVDINGSALINDIIDHNFKKEILGIEILDVVQEKDIYTAVKNANGFKPSLFVSEKAFEILMKHMIKKLQPVSLDCAESVA